MAWRLAASVVAYVAGGDAIQGVDVLTCVVPGVALGDGRVELVAGKAAPGVPMSEITLLRPGEGGLTDTPNA